jgi:hypothetical protein
MKSLSAQEVLVRSVVLCCCTRNLEPEEASRLRGILTVRSLSLCLVDDILQIGYHAIAHRERSAGDTGEVELVLSAHSYEICQYRCSYKG